MTGHRAAVSLLVRPNPIVLDADHLSRIPSRPARLREADYLDRYDAATLYFDVFAADDRLLALGPPLLNLKRQVRAARFEFDGRRLRAPQIRELDRLHRAVFATGTNGQKLTVRLGKRNYEAPVGVDLAGVLAGRRALMTLSLDNDLAWVRDWAAYHASAHGTDAVIVYDNGSRSYELDELLASVRSVPGIDVAIVVDWRFKYGPQGGPATPWDSDYAQYGALEHARWRFLRQAFGFLNADIDELVVAVDGASVYDLAAASRRGALSYPGRWIYPSAEAEGPPRHRDMVWYRPEDTLCSTKWCVVPSRLADGAQLQVHDVRRVRVETPSGLGYRHFRAISTHWKEDRTGRSTDLVRDEVLARALGEHLGSTDEAR